MLFDIINN